jgi:hypothetical protein
MGASLAVKMDKVVESIAAKFGETGRRQIAQIHRMVATAGPTWCLLAASVAEAAIADGDALWTALRDGRRRTPGGVFFAVARARASALVAEGKLSRRQFFRAFTDRPKKQKVAKTVPVRPGGKKARKDVTHNWGVPRTHDKRSKAPVPVEVYVTRRRA